MDKAGAILRLASMYTDTWDAFSRWYEKEARSHSLLNIMNVSIDELLEDCVGVLQRVLLWSRPPWGRGQNAAQMACQKVGRIAAPSHWPSDLICNV
eukprot:312429-Amphidinium_carterae.1